jgi:hypothetical protein
MAGAQLIRCLACGTTDRAPLSFIAVPPTENADPGSTVPLCAAERVVTRRKSSGSCPGAGNWLVKSLRFDKDPSMNIAGQFTVAAFLLALPLVSACSMMKPEATVEIPTTESPQDEALSKSVRDRLLADKKVDLGNVKVISSGGKVYLSGTVKSLDARQQAITTAWTVPGVQSVVNALEVQK